MAVATIGALEHTVQLTEQWLQELAEKGGFDDDAQAYTVMRAALHALRDRLTVDEASHLAAQLPMLVRGFYYEGWKPAAAPNKERDLQSFLDHVKSSLKNSPVDPEDACKAVFALLDEKITQGEMEDVRQMLPPEIRNPLWPGR